MIRPVEILLVEDDPGDVLLTREAFEESKIINRLSVVRDGVEALEFLRRQGPHAEAPRPDVILLDWNLPRMSGWEVLEELKADPDLQTIPVIVLTTSTRPEDVDRAYHLRAASYVAKPVDFERFVDVVRAIEGFWLGAVVYCPNPR